MSALAVTFAILAFAGWACAIRAQLGLIDARVEIVRARRAGRAEAIDHLRTGARLHQGQVGDARRRGALNYAADQIQAGRAPGRSA